MRLSQIDSTLFKRAVTTYLRLAYRERAIPIRTTSLLDWLCNWDKMENVWREEHFETITESGYRKYFLRLGNYFYPHMKMGIVECTGSPDEFVFVADTHDRHFEIPRSAPDYEAFQQLQRMNEVLKEEIEKSWSARGIPTASTLYNRFPTPFLSNNLVREGLQILVVDDTQPTLILERKLLERSGFNVIACDSSSAALEAAKNYHIDAAIIDIMMPDMDGYELVDQLNLMGLKRFPIAFSSAMLIQQVKLEKADGYIPKPFTPDFLVRTIRELIALEPSKSRMN